MKYQSSELNKYAVHSRYIVGFEERESTIYFQSESAARAYISQKPATREYLGLVTTLEITRS